VPSGVALAVASTPAFVKQHASTCRHGVLQGGCVNGDERPAADPDVDDPVLMAAD